MSSSSIQTPPLTLTTKKGETATVLLGGTFDPFHVGHRAILTLLHEVVTAHEWLVVPLAIPGHRAPPHASAADRVEMVRAGIADLPWVHVETCEVDRGGVTYTVDTTRELLNRMPLRSLWWIVGVDEALTLPQWHEFHNLMEIANFLVVRRVGQPAITLEELSEIGVPTNHVRVCQASPPEMSASEVRRRVGEGSSIAGCVPDGVAELIAEKGLYKRQGRRILEHLAQE